MANTGTSNSYDQLEDVVRSEDFDQLDDARKAIFKRESRCRRVDGFLTAFLEFAFIFGIFFVYGAWPTPDVNEQYYVGKAIHFWNREWLANDPFLTTPDSHWLFYATFGLLSFCFKQNAMVWIGRVLAWGLTALAWRRLSRALVPCRWFSVLSAAAFAFYLESFHLAGEWIIGGVEGKSFAFPLVFWGLALFLEGKLNRAWLCLGCASAFHPLVGGWTVLACLFSWVIEALFSRRSSKPRFFKFLPGLALGGAVSLLGVVPALRLDAGATPDVVAASRQIYVFKRLSHHLVASSLPWSFLLRFGALTLAFFLLVALCAIYFRYAKARGLKAPEYERLDAQAEETTLRFARLRRFVVASVLFACFGIVVDFGAKYWAKLGLISDPRDVAGILRYYWYRLSDWAVPLGVVAFAGRLAISVAYGGYDLLTKGSLGRGGLTNRFVAILRTFLIASAFGCALYGATHYVLYRAAAKTARAAAVAGSIPTPQSTERPSFIVAFVLFVVAIMFVCGVSRLFSRRVKSGVAPRTTFVALLGTALVFLLIAAPAERLGYFVNLRGEKVVPRSEPPKESIADGWRDMCRWIAKNTEKDAVFLAPRQCDSFKWLAGRAEAGSWKEIPQDARSIVEWNRRMELFYANPGAEEGSPMRWNQALSVVFINKGRPRILQECQIGGYDYAILESATYAVFANKEATRRWNEFIENDAVYQNAQFVLLKLKKDE